MKEQVDFVRLGFACKRRLYLIRRIEDHCGNLPSILWNQSEKPVSTEDLEKLANALHRVS